MLNKESTGFDEVLNLENERARAEEAVASLRGMSDLWGKASSDGEQFQKVFGCECHEFWEVEPARDVDEEATCREVMEAVEGGWCGARQAGLSRKSDVGVQCTGGLVGGECPEGTSCVWSQML